MAEWNTINSVGVLGIATGTNPIQQFTDAGYTKVTTFNEVTFNRGTLVPSIVNSNVAVGVTDDYAVTATVNIELAVNDELIMGFFVNNVQAGPEVHIQGAGVGKPVFLTGTHWRTFTAGDVIDIRGRKGNAGVTNVTFTWASLVLEHF